MGRFPLVDFGREEVDARLLVLARRIESLLLVDAENNSTREITITPSLLTAYKAEYAKYCEAVESYCGKYQLGYVRTTTDFPFDELVLKVFRQGRFLK